MKSLHWYIAILGFVNIHSFCSCSSTEASLDDVKMVNVLNVDAPLKITMADLVDSVSYIPLSTDICLLSSIESVQYDSGFFFIKDARGLYVFNESGTFINEIGKKGPGPEEYRYINAFFLNKAKREVCIISHPDGRLLTYSYCGDFLSVSKLEKGDVNVSAVIPMSDSELLAHRPLPNNMSENDSEYVMMAFEEDTYVSYPLLENIDISTRNAEYSFLQYPVASFNGKYCVISTFSNIVYGYTGKALEPEFYLNMPDISPTKDFIESHSDLDFFSLSKLLDEKNVGKGIMAIASSGENLFMSVKDGQTVIYDGKEAIVLAPLIYNSDVGNYFYTLFTGGLFDDILGHYEAEVLLSKREYINDGNNFSLKHLIANLNEEDNPVVFRCHLKKNLFEYLKMKLNGEK